MEPKFLPRCFRPNGRDLIAARKLRIKGFYLKKIENTSKHHYIASSLNHIKCLTKADISFSHVNSKYLNSLKTSCSLKSVVLNFDSKSSIRKTNLLILKKVPKALKTIKISFVCSTLSRLFFLKIYKILRHFQNLQVYYSDIAYTYLDPMFKEYHQRFLKNLQITPNTDCSLLRQYFPNTYITQYKTKGPGPRRKITLPLKVQDLFPNLISLTLCLDQDHPRSFYSSLQESFQYLVNLKNFHLAVQARSSEISEFLSGKQLLSLPLLDSLKLNLPLVSGLELNIFSSLLQKQTSLILLSITLPDPSASLLDNCPEPFKKLRFLEVSAPNSLAFPLHQSFSHLESLTLSNFKDEVLDPQIKTNFCEFLIEQKETLRTLALDFGFISDIGILNSILIAISKLHQLKELKLSSISLHFTEDFQLEPTLQKLQKLESLKLTFRERLSENDSVLISAIINILQGLSSLKALKTLSFNIPVSKVPGYMEYLIQNALSKLENLTTVAIDTSYIFDDDDEEYLRKIVAKINLKQSQKSTLMFF